LPSCAGAISRIVPMLAAPGLATGPRNDCDIVVTEHGIARLRDLHLDARAEALIAIAAPVHRGSLADAWRDIRAKL
jgi:acyl-CoA hydrolase